MLMQSEIILNFQEIIFAKKIFKHDFCEFIFGNPLKCKKINEILYIKHIFNEKTQTLNFDTPFQKKYKLLHIDKNFKFFIIKHKQTHKKLMFEIKKLNLKIQQS